MDLRLLSCAHPPDSPASLHVSSPSTHLSSFSVIPRLPLTANSNSPTPTHHFHSNISPNSSSLSPFSFNSHLNASTPGMDASESTKTASIPSYTVPITATTSTTTSATTTTTTTTAAPTSPSLASSHTATPPRPSLSQDPSDFLFSISTPLPIHATSFSSRKSNVFPLRRNTLRPSRAVCAPRTSTTRSAWPDSENCANPINPCHHTSSPFPSASQTSQLSSFNSASNSSLLSTPSFAFPISPTNENTSKISSFTSLPASSDLTTVTSSSRYQLPAKTSPLKRTDGFVNLERPSFCAPLPKRRSLFLNNHHSEISSSSYTSSWSNLDSASIDANTSFASSSSSSASSSTNPPSSPELVLTAKVKKSSPLPSPRNMLSDQTGAPFNSPTSSSQCLASPSYSSSQAPITTLSTSESRQNWLPSFLPPRALSLRPSTLQQRQDALNSSIKSPSGSALLPVVPTLSSLKNRQQQNQQQNLSPSLSSSSSPLSHTAKRGTSSLRNCTPLSTSMSGSGPSHRSLKNRECESNIKNGKHTHTSPASKSPISSSTLSSSTLTLDSSSPTNVTSTLGRKWSSSNSNGSRLASGFSRSLPLGVNRSELRFDEINVSESSNHNKLSTPSWKNAKPHPSAFMSTGLISKRNRVSDENHTLHQGYAMPDTPSKRVSYPSRVGQSPSFSLRFLSKSTTRSDFPSPATPLVSRNNTPLSHQLFGKGANIMGSRVKKSSHIRRRRVSDLDGTTFEEKSSSGEDDCENISPFPSANLDSQSSNDELPPTPTKPAGSGRRQKENSLRSSLLGRRKALAPDLFVPPKNCCSGSSVTPDCDQLAIKDFDGSSENSRVATPSLNNAPLYVATSNHESVHNLLPHTPLGQATPSSPQALDETSSLSCSSSGEPGSMLCMSMASFAAAAGFSSDRGLPSTPTTSRDSVGQFGAGSRYSVTGVCVNDVDTTLTSRFGIVALLGSGEFSQVFRVEKPVTSHTPMRAVDSSIQSDTTTFVSSNKLGSATVWAVKKTKRPYTGPKDRECKILEADILRSLRGHDHVITFVSSWESKNHLYIQTEFCENGNLKDFLTQAGYKARLDDFRIWKILLELSLGIRFIHSNNFIHLDLKPANIFIDWGGLLKIGDFGLASPWPAPEGIDGEGDREYIGPEVLDGIFDKPADIFALGMIMLEIAGNIVLPDNGMSWQRLRVGDLRDLPSLTWSSESTLARNQLGDPVDTDSNCDKELLNVSGGCDTGRSASCPNHINYCMANKSKDGTCSTSCQHFSFESRLMEELVQPPKFMRDSADDEALDRIIQWMISPNPHDRPIIDQVYLRKGVQWVQQRRRAGATIYEGNWGPADSVLAHSNAKMDTDDVDTCDIDMADA